MLSIFSKKMMMAGMITITLPFGGWTITIPQVQPAVSQAQPVSQIQPSFAPAWQQAQPTNPTAVNSGVSSNSSYNWSGYEATGGTFTSVNGTWTVPSVPSANSTEADATWVGIGGVASHDLIQAGTQALINGSGAPQYQAWYEILPATTQQVPLTVSPGDSMSVSITQTSAASGVTPADWSVSIRDNTTGQSYQTSLAYNSSLSSAEWIEEMPSDGSSFVPLDNFGTVGFTGGTATENGNSVSISGANAQELTMVNTNDQTLASPSAIGSDGESFTVARSSATATAANIFGGGGLGRGWRRTGVGIQGFTPRGFGISTGGGGGFGRTQTITTTTVTTGAGFGAIGTGATVSSSAWQSLYQLMQQLRQLQAQQLQQQAQNFSEGLVRSGTRIWR